jgi:hypothetical protein
MDGERSVPASVDWTAIALLFPQEVVPAYGPTADRSSAMRTFD